MKLRKLLDGIRIEAATGPSWQDIEISGIACDSRAVRPGALFIALRGPSQDGHAYIADALARGAAAVICEDMGRCPRGSGLVSFLAVRNSKAALLRAADIFFGSPGKNIKCVGITGTNGKTTTSYLVRSILAAAGKKCGLVGTIGYSISDIMIPAQNTTPGVLELTELLRDMVEAGCEFVVMEVSSHALDQERVAGVVFDAAIFTNLTQDHLDYHKTMEEYFSAKEKLFRRHVHEETTKIINIDDPYGRRLLKSVGGKVTRYGFAADADVRVEDFTMSPEGSRATIVTPQGTLEITTPLVGRHNLANIAAAVAFGAAQGLDSGVIRRGVEALACVPGRLDRIDTSRGVSVFIDYAHTDDALKNVLESLRPLAHNGRIITVFGCGGERDRGKRPKMGRVATELSDYCILTSDNPRGEDPMLILEEIKAGIAKDNFCIELDRARALERAIGMSRRGDIVLVAGKGHETYQIIRDQRLPFDDKVVVRGMLERMDQDV